MKILSVASLLLVITYPAALVGAAVGVLPAAVMSLPAFVGFFAAACMVLIVVHDYSRPPASYGQKRRTVPSIRPVRPAPPGAAWIYRTVS